MAFDAEGYRKAARQAGIPTDVINQTVAEKTGIKGWLTGGKQGLGGLVNAAGEILNLPSYAIGGFLNKVQNEGAGAVDQTKNPLFLRSASEGIRNKTPVMSELPETVGVDPNSGAGLALGFAGELLTPDPVGFFSDAYKGLRGASKADDLGLFARGARRTGEALTEEASNIPLRGLGRNNTTKRMLARLDSIGMTPDEFMDQYKLWGRNADEAQSALNLVDDAYKRAAYQSGQTVDAAQVVSEFNKEIQKLSQQAGQSRAARTQLDRVIEARDAFLQSVDGGLNTGMGQVPVGSVADAKSFVSKDIPQSYFNAGSAQKGAGKGAETARRIFKKSVDTATGGETARLGGAESALIDYRQLLKNAEAANRGNSNLPFTKLIAPGAGFAAGGPLGAVVGYGAQRFANSPVGLATQSKTLRGAGRALQNPRTLQGINKASQYGNKALRTGFRVSQQSTDEGSRGTARNKRTQLPNQLEQNQVSPTLSVNSNPVNTEIQLFSDRDKRKRRIF